MADFNLRQKQGLSQQQNLTARQIQSLTLLSCDAESLREEIYKELEKNPALIIKKDNFTGNTKTTSKISADGEAASSNFMAALESAPDQRESLTEHLLAQFNVLPLNPGEKKLGQNLIYNLNSEGFHTLSPYSLLDKDDPLQTEECLQKVIEIIQKLDPVGCCCTNLFESLYIQAKQKKNCPKLALFILDGHYKDFLDSAKTEKILKKILAYKKEKENLFGDTEFTEKYPDLKLTESEVKKAVDFIKTLEPHPARNFFTTDTCYVAPDVYVEKVPNADPKEIKDNFEKGIVSTMNAVFYVHTAKENEVLTEINPQFEELVKSGEISKEDRISIEADIKKAREFIDSLIFRKNTILRATCCIVKIQHDFFLNGSGHLKPLRQIDIAKMIDVHETTISRMANSKYLYCEWGLFEIKTFFDTAISRSTSLTVQEAQKKAQNAGESVEEQKEDFVSRDNVLFQIKQILNEHKNDKKNLSDQKLSDLLSERGIKVARRTVAKYRALLNIESSYSR